MGGLRKIVATALVAGACFPVGIFAETVTIFADTTIGQLQFAAGDIKTALVAKGFSVDIQSLESLSSGSAQKKVVVGLASNSALTTVLTGQGGTTATGLGAQAFGLRTTSEPQLSYWVLGGDINGAMYGGLQVAENITLSGFSGTYNIQDTAFIKQRGIKINLPFDKRLPTYQGEFLSRSSRRAIKDVWDTTFWKTYIDQQARQRYNFLSVWNNHPFPALVQLADYPKTCLPDIQYYDGTINASLDYKTRVAIMRRIMRYAHDRGMKFFIFNWNVILDYAVDQGYGLQESTGSAATKTYLGKCIQALIETYPDLDGFGVSPGDNMGASGAPRAQWVWEAFGKATYEYLSKNPSRNFTLIHRGLGDVKINHVDQYFKSLHDLTNATVNYSVKYSSGHMYSSPTPRWHGDLSEVLKSNYKTFLTCRNEDFFFTNWGDPQFVRDFIMGIPSKSCVEGIYIGSDNISPTRTYLYKNGYTPLNGQLEIQRKWYTEMLWGRISYNKDVNDNVFKATLAARFPTLPTDNFFKAWTLASRGLPKVTELVQGSWNLDHHWYLEGCFSQVNKWGGFRLINGANGFENTSVSVGSNLCNIATSAANGCGVKKSSYMLANEIQAYADTALQLINSLASGGNRDLDVAINNVKQLAYLSEYYAYKIRGATFNKAGNKASAAEAMGKAYCWWMAYTRSMDAMYEGDSMNRYEIFPDWKFADEKVFKEYTDLKGSGGAPSDCESIAIMGKQHVPPARKPVTIKGITPHRIVLDLANNEACAISLFTMAGKQVMSPHSFMGKQGINRVAFKHAIIPGTYVVRVKVADFSPIVQKVVAQK